MSKKKPRCGATEASCECVRKFGHKGAHECDPKVCGGSWTTDDDGLFSGVVRFPGVGINTFSWMTELFR